MYAASYMCPPSFKLAVRLYDDPYMNAAPTKGDTMEFADRIERLRAISDGAGDLYTNDELLAVDVGYAYAGPLSAEQMAVEADAILEALLEAA